MIEHKYNSNKSKTQQNPYLFKLNIDTQQFILVKSMTLIIKVLSKTYFYY